MYANKDYFINYYIDQGVINFYLLRHKTAIQYQNEAFGKSDKSLHVQQLLNVARLYLTTQE